MHRSVLLLLLWSGWVAGRDPFQPLAASRCQAAAAPQGWHLQGIAGQPAQFVAWLISPQGQSHRLRAQTAFPEAPWQVAELTARTLRLTAAHSCPPQHITWSIKGGHNEKDGTAAVSGAEHAAAR